MTSPLLGYLQGLAENNNKTSFEEHRGEYQGLRQEFTGLVGEILARLAVVNPAVEHLRPADCLFRINRDVRFSRDKSPYKTQFSALFCPQGRNVNLPSYYFHVAANREEGGELLAGGGMYAPSRRIWPLSAVSSRRIPIASTRFWQTRPLRPWAEFTAIRSSGCRPAYRPMRPIWPHCCANNIFAGETVAASSVAPADLADWVVARFTSMVPFIQWLRDALGPPAAESVAEKPPIDIF